MENENVSNNKNNILFGWISFGLGIATWFLFFFSLLLSPAAVVLGIISLKKEGKHWSSIVGIILGGVSILAMISSFFFLASSLFLF
ncbi:MAG: hypothetical protein FWF50_02190 [Defluviitaleaceae bacterium]|nr:hypothetical protein [Defluviitaleaceae bacterium]